VDDVGGGGKPMLHERAAEILEPLLVGARDAGLADVRGHARVPMPWTLRFMTACASWRVGSESKLVTYRAGYARERMAREHAAVLLKDLPARWTHTEAVAKRARLVVEALRLGHEGDILMAASYLHDVGYAPAVRETGFHPLDGALHLRAVGRERLARLVAYHSGAIWEARLRELDQRLASFEPEVSVVADAQTYCDMTTGPAGELVTLAQRLTDVERRHGVDSLVMKALRGTQPELQRVVSVIEAALHEDMN
jgi:hypothetical protein